MKVEIVGRNYDVSEHLKQVTESKLAKLDKYFVGMEARVRVCCKKQASSLTTEVMLEYASKLVRATATSDNFYDNLDLVLPKLEGQIRKYRTKFDKDKKNSAFINKAEFDAEIEYETKATAEIVKEKKFHLKPMTIQEAIEEMELLGHSFYIFLEIKTHTVQVLYARFDGSLGLINPQI